MNLHRRKFTFADGNVKVVRIYKQKQTSLFLPLVLKAWVSRIRYVAHVSVLNRINSWLELILFVLKYPIFPFSFIFKGVT